MKKALSFFLVFLMVFSLLPAQSLGQGFINDLFSKIDEKEVSSPPIKEEPPAEVSIEDSSEGSSKKPNPSSTLRNISSTFAFFTDEEERYLFHNLPYHITFDDFKIHGFDPLYIHSSSFSFEEEDPSFPSVYFYNYTVEELIFPFAALHFTEEDLYNINLYAYHLIPPTLLREDFLPYYHHANQVFNFLVKHYGPPTFAHGEASLFSNNFLFPNGATTFDKENFLALCALMGEEETFLLQYGWGNLFLSLSFSLDSYDGEFTGTIDIDYYSKAVVPHPTEDHFLFAPALNPYIPKEPYLFKNIPFSTKPKEFMKTYLSLQEQNPSLPPLEEGETENESRFYFQNMPYLGIPFPFGSFRFSEKGNYDTVALFYPVLAKDESLFGTKEEVSYLINVLFNLLTQNHGLLDGGMLTIFGEDDFLFFAPPVTSDGTFDPQAFEDILDILPVESNYSIDFFWNNINLAFCSYFSQEEQVLEHSIQIFQSFSRFPPVSYTLLPPYIN